MNPYKLKTTSYINQKQQAMSPYESKTTTHMNQKQQPI
jgi:hypothetical protein